MGRPEPKSTPLYPLRFKEIFKEKIWGGDGLKKRLGKPCNAKTGESWELADIGRDVSQVANGPWKGKRLDALLHKHAREIMGEDVHIRHRRFPLLVKFLWVEDRLSLQVHPSDEFARAFEPEGSGKMEAWYVVHAETDARVMRGVLPGTTEAEFREFLSGDKIEECVNKLRVQSGDVIFIPPGTIHSAYGGILLFELQQASDITYRLSDWGRTDASGRTRKTEPERAMQAMDMQSIGVSKLKPTRLPGFPYRRSLLIRCEKFTMELLDLPAGKRAREKGDPQRFRALTVLQGGGAIHYGAELKKSEPFRTGQTFLIPAFMGDYELRASRQTSVISSTT